MYAKITTEQQFEAEQYAKNKNLMKYSGETKNTTRREEQSYTGKCGEFGCFNLLKALGFTVSPPDCKIYPNPPTTPDLTFDKKGLEVKTTTPERFERYNNSWLIDNLGDDLVALCIVEGNKVHIKAILPAETIKKLQKRALHIDKPAIYLTDLPDKPFIKAILKKVAYENDMRNNFKDL